MIETVSSSAPRWSATATDTPIESIDLGNEFAVETLDCRAGTISGVDDIDNVPDASHINPITGPISIRGMDNGSVKSIRITEIHAVGQPLMLIRPGVTALSFVDSPPIWSFRRPHATRPSYAAHVGDVRYWNCLNAPCGAVR